MDAKDAKYLGLYSSLGTTLDFYFGIDAFFSFGFGIVTIDITANPNIRQHHHRYLDFIVYRDYLYTNWDDWCRKVAKLVYKRNDEIITQIADLEVAPNS